MKDGPRRSAVCIGGGPAGLTAAYELLQHTDIVPVVLEMEGFLGGIARTENHNGNRIDIGGHRFFSKSDRVMRWWCDLMPPEATAEASFEIAYHGQRRTLEGGQGPDPDQTDEVMLVRSRKSRIYYLRRFFDYPISLTLGTLRNLGAFRVMRLGLSYLRARVAPIRPEKSLEDFLINRFGRELYATFFRDYTEKVWGVPCNRIDPSWGAQRIKGLSITTVIKHALAKPFRKRGEVAQKDTETSLIERFLYPKLGPGQMWELCAKRITEAGGRVELGSRVERIHVEGRRVRAVTVKELSSGQMRRIEADHFFSTMPVRELVAALDCGIPQAVREIAAGLTYRDFLTVGLLLRDLKVRDERTQGLLRDNWIYIQEPEVKLGRLQIFNNWSPYLVADPSTVWVGLEYFCNEGDELWEMPDEEMAAFGAAELERIGIIDRADVLDHTVIRVPKCYPAYFGTYNRFDELRAWLDGIDNLYLVGRNGMHRYNNQDHSMLAAMTAVENILAGRVDKSNIWAVNTEQDYHEEKAG